MKKIMLIVCLACLIVSFFTGYALAAKKNIREVEPKIELKEPLWGVLKEMGTKPYSITIDVKKESILWQNGYTNFYDFEGNRISAVKFLESFKNRGIGIWLDQNNIALEVRPVNM